VIKLPPIYTEAYSLAQTTLRQTVNVPKAYRPTLGRRMEEAAIEIVVTLRQELLKQNVSIDTNHISLRVDELKVLIQLAYDLGIYRDSIYGELATSTDRIGKMLGGLAKHQTRHHSQGSARDLRAALRD
jgi:hypothetical protein